MSGSKFSLQQKLLMLVAAVILVAATLMLLRIWGVNIDSVFMGKIIASCTLIACVAGAMIAILSNMKDAKKDDKDNYFN